MTPGSRAVAIIVSVKINDGIVVAADSAGAMPSGHKLQYLGPTDYAAVARERAEPSGGWSRA